MKLFRNFFAIAIVFLGTSCAISQTNQPLGSDIRTSIGILLAENKASREIYLRKCFRLEGFAYKPSQASGANLVGVVPIVSFSGLKSLRKFGYGMADSEENISENDQNLAIFNTLPSNQRLQYIATQKKCDKTERTRSRPSVKKIQAISKAQDRFYKNTKVVAVTKTWSQCMTKKGFGGLPKRDFSVMDFVRKAAGDENFETHQRGDSSPLRAAELRIANADADCLEDGIRTLQAAWNEASQ